MSRLIPVSGLFAVASGGAWLVPAIVAWLERGSLGLQGYAVASVGLVLIMSGAVAAWCGFSELRIASTPSPVRATIAGNGFFVSFCALEFSDGLLRQDGRVFYWTSILFLPALVLFYGQVSAQRWAWWVARIVTAISTLWFVGFLLVMPFAHLRGNDGAVPWWGGFMWPALLWCSPASRPMPSAHLGVPKQGHFMECCKKPEIGSSGGLPSRPVNDYRDLPNIHAAFVAGSQRHLQAERRWRGAVSHDVRERRRFS